MPLYFWQTCFAVFSAAVISSAQPEPAAPLKLSARDMQAFCAQINTWQSPEAEELSHSFKALVSAAFWEGKFQEYPLACVDGERAIAPKLGIVGLVVATTGGGSGGTVVAFIGSGVSGLGEVVGEATGELVAAFVTSAWGILSAGRLVSFGIRTAVAIAAETDIAPVKIIHTNGWNLVKAALGAVTVTWGVVTGD